MKWTAVTAAGTWAGVNASASELSANSVDAFGGEAVETEPLTGGQQAVPLAPPDKQPPDLKVPEPVKRKVGYAVVGLGELALEQVMPAFREAKMSEPVALVSGHPDKARKVAETYGIDPKNIYDYQNYDRMADNPRIEAVYIILPNSMHAEYTIRGLKAGKHVLCEKPMAVNVKECEQMIAASQQTNRKLMIAYRLHYEPYNLKVMELCRQKAIGEIKTFTSANCQQVKAPNIRLSKALAGGPIGDVGIYSINAARYVIGEEPIEAIAFAHQPSDDPRFREVPETVSYTLRYPSGMIAQCECGFGHSRSERYRVLGTTGYIEMDPAFGYNGQRLVLKQGEAQEQSERKAELRLTPKNQFAAELDHFSDCVMNSKDPNTPGEMGLADMRIVAAIEESMRSGKSVRIRR